MRTKAPPLTETGGGGMRVETRLFCILEAPRTTERKSDPPKSKCLCFLKTRPVFKLIGISLCVCVLKLLKELLLMYCELQYITYLKN